MTRFNSWALVLLALALLVAGRTAIAAESYGNCTGFITSVPTAVSTPGIWCFNQNLTTSITSGTAITINTDNVTIDCNDFKLDGLSAGVGTATIAIHGNDRFNTTVRHCNIRGFLEGVLLGGTNTGGHTVEDNRLDGNTDIGLQVIGNGSVVRRNRVFDTGGSTVTPSRDGIIGGYDVDIADNLVSGVVAGVNGTVNGIYMFSNSAGSIIGNHIRGLVPNGTGSANGIINDSSDRIVLRDNEVVGDASAHSIGVACGDSNGRARDNMISGFATGLASCGNDGGNVIKP
jgi:hypothetical protein